MTNGGGGGTITGESGRTSEQLVGSRRAVQRAQGSGNGESGGGTSTATSDAGSAAMPTRAAGRDDGGAQAAGGALAVDTPKRATSASTMRGHGCRVSPEHTKAFESAERLATRP